MNTLKTAMLIGFMTALFMGVGLLVGGGRGMAVAFVVAVATNLLAYWNADRMVLRMHDAQEVDARTAPDYHAIVRTLADKAGLPMPRVYLVHQDQPNAFATGRNPENAAVAATTGLLRSLSPEELAGVMAHELAHIQNRDTLIMTITATIAGAISMLGNFAFVFGGNRQNSGPLGGIGVLLGILVAPFAAMLVQMAVSRTREYAADRRGAEICGQPLWLASALAKIATAAGRTVNVSAERNPATAHMFIVNPLNGQRMDGLFSTHPDTGNRIEALRAMTDIAPAGLAPLPAGRTSGTPAATGPWSRGPSRGRVPNTGPRKGPWG